MGLGREVEEEAGWDMMMRGDEGGAVGGGGDWLSSGRRLVVRVSSDRASR